MTPGSGKRRRWGNPHPNLPFSDFPLISRGSEADPVYVTVTVLAIFIRYRCDSSAIDSLVSQNHRGNIARISQRIKEARRAVCRRMGWPGGAPRVLLLPGYALFPVKLTLPPAFKKCHPDKASQLIARSDDLPRSPEHWQERPCLEVVRSRPDRLASRGRQTA